jgi:DHA1 family tetracycline resistance protein-like MFS transporter
VKEIAPSGVSVAFVAIGLALVIDLLQFFCAPIIVSLSDAIGRRAIMALSLGVMVVSNLLRATAGDVAHLALASVVLGVFAGMYGASMAAVADYTPPSGRAARFGSIGSAVTVGYTLGPMLGGLLADFDPRTPYYAACAFSLLNLVLVLTLFRETLPKALRKTFTLRLKNPLGAVLFYRRTAHLPRLALAYAALQSTMAFLPVLIPLYLLEQLKWSGGKAGLYIAFMCAMSFVFQASLPGLLVRRLGSKPTTVVALTIGALGFCVVGVSTAEWLLWLGAALMPVRNVATATISALMSEQVPADEQGTLQGSNASLFGIARVGAQLALLGSYGLAGARGASNGMFAVPFLLAAAVLMIGAATVWSLRRVKAATAE